MPHEVDPFARKFIRDKATQLRYRAAPAGLDLDDVEGELLLHLARKLKQFDPNRGKWTTFVRMVTNHRAADLVAHWSSTRQRSTRRFAARGQCEADSESPGGSADCHRRLLDLPCEPAVEPDIESLVRRLDLQNVMERLSDEDRWLCQLLSKMPRKRLVKALGVSDSAIESKVRRIRKVFEQAQLHQYLPKSPKKRDTRKGLDP